TTGLPLGIGLNFRVNHSDHLVPMAVEEPSVVAAASNAARLVRISGGFVGEADPPLMTAQIQFDEVSGADRVEPRIAERKDEILASGDRAIPRMVERGGGCRDIEVRVLDAAAGMVAIHLYIDVGNAMGANLVDTVAEAVAPLLHDIVGGRLGLRILSNLPLRRMVTVSGSVSDEAIGGEELSEGIVRASRFAEADPLRAATHNKGIMNGIDAVALALGQDWRAIEASAHAYASLSGQYRPLAVWRRTSPEQGGAGLTGTLTMPLAVGTVGGATRVNPGVRAGLELLGVDSARHLAVVMAAVGLASNLAALRALAGEGLQRGHMKLHRRRLDPEFDRPSWSEPGDHNAPARCLAKAKGRSE
ncbi:MAG: hydroxymethylglutaryl-CoA reductase, degradative, partial [Proteobacteria bacterium]|nr:hydroxymethylglutaryl-CoA reductase, degradative [Pseudomonadota bacterium]